MAKKEEKLWGSCVTAYELKTGEKKRFKINEVPQGWSTTDPKAAKEEEKAAKEKEKADKAEAAKAKKEADAKAAQEGKKKGD